MRGRAYEDVSKADIRKRRYNMKNLLVGNGVNIQFDKKSYTTQQIVLRILKNFDRDDFPSHIIFNSPFLLKNYIGQLFLAIREIVQGKYDSFTICDAEKKALEVFKECYSDKIQTLKITDIGFEDYYLVHDLVCHKLKVKNPNQFHIREEMKMAYFFSIYNDGKLNTLHLQYSDKFKKYLNGFDSVFTTNYDSNIDAVADIEVFHIHGQFDKLSDIYDANSFRNHLPDEPIKAMSIDRRYSYLYSNALSTHCGEYKFFQLKQASTSNNVIEKMAEAYVTNSDTKLEIDKWTQNKNQLTANFGYAIQLKAKHSELEFSDNYHFDKFKAINGELEILGLSPWNDFHIFESINDSAIQKCIYYYYSKEQCKRIKLLLPRLYKENKLLFKSTTDFWREYI